MRLPGLSPQAFRRITVVAAVLLAGIIVSGGAVRVTGSGLGCSDWPQCEPHQLVPRTTADGHRLIEFANRSITGIVSVVVIVAVLGALVRRPRRRDLVWLSVGLVLGVVGQAILGGLTVLFDLRPEFVTAHFLLSLVLLTDAIVLCRRAARPDVPSAPVVVPSVLRLGRLLVGLATVVVLAGTVVTSTGPHGGDAKAKRFALYLPHVARVHGTAAMAFLLVIGATLVALRRTGGPPRVQRRIFLLLGVAAAQAGLGYYQYFSGIPALAVGFHIAGAVAVWSASVSVYLGMFEPVGVPAAAVPARGPVLAGTQGA